MKVYIVRHGQVPHNAKKVYSNENEDLNEVGLQQAKELKRDFDACGLSSLMLHKNTTEKLIICKMKTARRF